MFSRFRQRTRARHQHHHEHELHCTSLCCARRGECASVLRLTNEPGEAARLRDLGLREGALVTVLRDGDPLMVKVDDARIGVGRSAAMCIMCDIVKDAS